MNHLDSLDVVMMQVEYFIESNFGRHVLEALFSVKDVDTHGMPNDLIGVLRRWSFCESFTLISSKHSNANVQSTIQLGGCVYRILGVVYYKENGTTATHLLLWYPGGLWDWDPVCDPSDAENAENAESLDNCPHYTVDKRLYRYAPGDSQFICVYDDFLDLVTYFLEELQGKMYFWNTERQLLQKHF